MSAISTIQNADFTFKRESKPNKDGLTKVAVRDLLGLIASGNRKERDEAVAKLTTLYYCEGNFAALAGQLNRAFGTGLKACCPMGFNLETGTMPKDNRFGLTNRQAWGGIVDGIAEAHAAKPFKGERALFVAALKRAADTFAGQEAQRALEKEQALAQDRAGLGDNDSVIDVAATPAAAPALAAPVADAPAAVDALADALATAGDAPF